MSKKYNIIYNINDKVKIISLDLTGRINGLFISINEVSYRVRYIFGGEPKEVYFSHDEIELIPAEQDESLGFKQK